MARLQVVSPVYAGMKGDRGDDVFRHECFPRVCGDEGPVGGANPVN